MVDSALNHSRDTIVAVATASGRSGIGVVRVSGDQARNLAEGLTGRVPEPRRASLCSFTDADGTSIDQGIMLFFEGPASYTGEDVLELQGHGAPVLLDAVVKRIIQLGARSARPGEFTERAFLNGKLDLAQAEAVADLINAKTLAAARGASRSLAGDFSRAVNQVVEALTQLRIRVEAAIDFPEEELDLPGLERLTTDLQRLQQDLEALVAEAAQTVVLNEGLRVVLAGRPNVGKSSLMNRLLGDDRVIVSATPGTTRDVVIAETALLGIPVTLVDTAGLRETEDAIEGAGVERAHREIELADLILLIDDDSASGQAAVGEEAMTSPRLRVLNKIDLTGRESGIVPSAATIDRRPLVPVDGEKDGLPAETVTLAVSAHSGAGIDELQQAIIKLVGQEKRTVPRFVARRRHIELLDKAIIYLRSGTQSLQQEQTIELSAESFRLASQSLGEISGAITSDELLGRIFADFCIGK